MTERDVLNSVAYALCAHDESDEPDYGNDELAEWITRQLIIDGHVTRGLNLVLPVYDFADPARTGQAPCVVVNTPGIYGAHIWDGHRWTPLPDEVMATRTDPQADGGRT